MHRAARHTLVALGGVTALTAGLISAMSPAGAATEAVANDDPGFVQVYDDNVENLPVVSAEPDCAGDWQDLLYYLRLQTYKPDLFIVQQISNQAQLDDYVARISSDFGEKYAGVIAVANPIVDARRCSAKYHQTNAVIYRTARFSNYGLGNRTWQSQLETSSSGACTNNYQDRTKDVKVKLHDKIADRDLTVASVHWPTSSPGSYGGGPPCAQANAGEAVDELHEDGYGGDLLIFGGDTNISDVNWDASGDPYRAWYSWLNADLGGAGGYRDAVYSLCMGTDDVKGCLQARSTFGTKRIDFMFAKKSSGLPTIDGRDTIAFNDADQADITLTGTDRTDMNYSDHRAIAARIHY